MFSKGSKSAPATPPATTGTTKSEPTKSSAVPSIISADLKITGDLRSDGDIQVDGTIEGDIASRTLTVGEEAHVKGSISADTVRICGSVSGQVKAGSVILAKTAKIEGDIVHESLAIEAGAYVEGNIRRLQSAKSAEKAKVAVMKPAREEAPSGGREPIPLAETKPAAG